MVYKIWEVGVYKAQTIKAPNMHAAVKQFAGTDVLAIKDTLGARYTNPYRYIASDGSAREFHVKAEDYL